MYPKQIRRHGFAFRDNLTDWFRLQIRALEAWREELARQPDLDKATVQRVEAHYQWLTREIALMEAGIEASA